jgi:hypothetical protein
MAPTVTASKPASTTTNGNKPIRVIADDTPRENVLAWFAAKEITTDQLVAYMDRQKQIAVEAAKPKPGVLSAKLSPRKRVISVYGLQRNPVSLYREQWFRLLAFAEQLTEYINKPEVKSVLDAWDALSKAEQDAHVAEYDAANGKKED